MTSQDAVAAGPEPARPDVPDGKSYVDAAIAAGGRSRTIIYFIVTLVVLTFTSIRNQYDPDWMTSRAEMHQELHTCLTKGNPQHPDCQEILRRMDESDVIRAAKKMGYKKLTGKIEDSNFSEENKIILDELKMRIDSYLKKGVEFYTITIPVLGSVIDVNDLWLISGLVMCFLLYLLRASLEQEHRNIEYISQHKSVFVPLVAMHQVLAGLTVHTTPAYRYWQFALGMIPAWLYLYLLYFDLHTLHVSIAYVGKFRTYLEYAFEILAVAVILRLNYKCVRSQYRLRDLIARLAPQTSINFR